MWFINLKVKTGGDLNSNSRSRSIHVLLCETKYLAICCFKSHYPVIQKHHSCCFLAWSKPRKAPQILYFLISQSSWHALIWVWQCRTCSKHYSTCRYVLYSMSFSVPRWSRPMWGSHFLTDSPLSSRTRRNTPWAAGCWGPKLMVRLDTSFSAGGSLSKKKKQ